MATLVLGYDAANAVVSLAIDGTTWAVVPAKVTATRQSPGGALVRVRGIIDRAIVGGYLVASDHEMDLNATVTYTVTGYDTAGAVVGTATAAIATTTAGRGCLFVKAPGRPDLTVRCDPASAPDFASATIGGNYQILGGGSVSVAQWGGMTPDAATITLRTDAGPDTAALRKLLATERVVLLQPVGLTDLDAGWYFVANVNRSNPGGFEDFAFRYTALSVEATREPAGQRAGAAWTWNMLVATYDTWDDVTAAYASWFVTMQGAA